MTGTAKAIRRLIKRFGGTPTKTQVKALIDEIPVPSGSGGGGGSDIVYIPATFDYESGSPVLVCDVTYDTIKGYIESGKVVYIAITDEGETLICSLCYYSFSNHRIMWSIVTDDINAITYGIVKLEGTLWGYSSILLMTDQ